MIIRVKDADSFRCASHARASKDFQAVFRYIRLGPTGTITGTDGYVLAHNPNGCYPFEGDKDVFVNPAKHVPTTARTILVDTEAKIIRWSKHPFDEDRAPEDLMGMCDEVISLLDVTTDLQMPDVERVIPSTRREGAGEPFAVNIKYVERLTKGCASHLGANNGVTFEASGPNSAPMLLRPSGAHPDLILMVIPLRDSAWPRLTTHETKPHALTTCYAALRSAETVRIHGLDDSETKVIAEAAESIKAALHNEDAEGEDAIAALRKAQDAIRALKGGRISGHAAQSVDRQLDTAFSLSSRVILRHEQKERRVEEEEAEAA